MRIEKVFKVYLDAKEKKCFLFMLRCLEKATGRDRVNQLRSDYIVVNQNNIRSVEHMLALTQNGTSIPSDIQVAFPDFWNSLSKVVLDWRDARW